LLSFFFALAIGIPPFVFDGAVQTIVGITIVGIKR
jgi:hypothetical protein